VGRHPHRKQVEPEGALARIEPPSQDQARRQEEKVRRPPQREDARRAPAPEVRERQPRRRASVQQAPGEREATDDEEQLDALVAGPADPARQVERDVTPSVAGEWRQLRDAIGERRPARVGGGRGREAEETLGGRGRWSQTIHTSASAFTASTQARRSGRAARAGTSRGEASTLERSGNATSGCTGCVQRAGARQATPRWRPQAASSAAGLSAVTA